MSQMHRLTSAVALAYAYSTAPHWAGGFCRPNNSGAMAMRRSAHGFFYAIRFMAGGVLGGCKARRLLSPLCKPGTSSAAICFAALVGGLNHYSGVQL